MVKIKVFNVNSINSCNADMEDKELAPMEEFISKIGYDSIKNIVMSNAGAIHLYYTIFYEDGMPYTPRPIPEKKGLFGR